MYGIHVKLPLLFCLVSVARADITSLKGSYCGGELNWVQPERGAWVLPVTVDTLDSYYIPLTLGSIECIRSTGTKYDIVVLYDGPYNETIGNMFRAVDVSKVIHVSKLAGLNRTHLATKNSKVLDHGVNIWRGTWNKIIAFGLVDYPKVVAIDPDAIVSAPCDDLFKYPHISASPDLSLQSASLDEKMDSFNAGLLVLEPSLGLAQELLELVGSHNDAAWVGVQSFFNKRFGECWRALPIQYNMRPLSVDKMFSMWQRAVWPRVVHHTGRSHLLATFTKQQCRTEYDYCKECCERYVDCRDRAFAKLQAAGINLTPGAVSI